MKNILPKWLIMIALCVGGVAPALATAKSDSLIKVLDAEIANRSKYVAQKRQKLKALSMDLYSAQNALDSFSAAYALFHEYKNFSMDTTLLIARDARKIAERTKNDSVLGVSMLMEAEARKGLGQYAMALGLLRSIPPEAAKKLHKRILYRYTSIYYSLMEVSAGYGDGKLYRDTLIMYRDSLLLHDRTQDSFAVNQIEKLKEQGNYRGAISQYDAITGSDRYSEVHLKGLDYIMAEAYEAVGNTDKALELMLETAISDIRKCDRRYKALPAAANILCQQGDISHAYGYIITSLNDIKDANAQSRMWSITHNLPIITKAYAEYQRRMKTQNHMALFGILMFVAMMVCSGAIIHSRNKRLRHERLLLRDKNDELTQLKQKADALNAKLSTSSNVKDEYIGRLFNLCSDYINLMTSEHNAILKQLRTGSIKDAEKQIASLKSPDRLASFFDSFDKCFLDIFPGFVDQFNSHLRPECQITPPAGQLTPELRIFALMRLGITETSKIAAFLHYSNQTVYNYRFKIKSYLRDDAPDILGNPQLA